MNLPARVRISELKKPPEPALLERLKRIEPEKAAQLERGVAAGQRLAVVIAGGAAIGWALGGNFGPRGSEKTEVENRALELAMMAVWRGRGIEKALHELFGAKFLGTEGRALEGIPHEA